MIECESCKQKVDTFSITHFGGGDIKLCKECTILGSMTPRTCITCKNLPETKIIRKSKGKGGKMMGEPATYLMINGNPHFWVECTSCKGLWQNWIRDNTKCKECNKNKNNIIKVGDTYYCDKVCYKKQLDKLKLLF